MLCTVEERKIKKKDGEQKYMQKKCVKLVS